MDEAAEFLLYKALAIVPVDTGFLRSTGKVRYVGRGFERTSRVVFTAAYSIWVHERLDLAHGKVYNIKYAEDIAAGRKRSRGPQEQAKFIETPLRVFKKDLLEIIRNRMAKAGRQAKADTKALKRKKK